jgi:hypothetical protein
MGVRLDSGELKGLKPKNLAKLFVGTQGIDSTKSLSSKVKGIFSAHDTNGDGCMDRQELARTLFDLKLDVCLIDKFMRAIDKDHDGLVQYEEFVDWLVRTGGGGLLKSEATGPTGDDVDEPDNVSGQPDLTLDDLKKAVGPDVDTKKWPDHVTRLANNMHDRFPDYPIEGLVWMMIKHSFHGGNVVQAIRETNPCEIEAKPRAMSSNSFPAKYRVRDDQKALDVYREEKTNWSFPLMRDGRIPAHGKLQRGQEFWVLEARSGVAYGSVFARIEYNQDYNPEHKYWTVLGLELERDGIGTKHFSAAERLTL